MTKLLFVAMACLALCGCASSYAVDQQVALANCQAVGISQKDPQLATCMQAQIQGRRERQLEQAFENGKHIVPNERMTRHADEIF
jgi:uncharacterized protein YcfL